MAKQTPQSERPEGGPRKIARLNDWLREHITSPGANRVVMTAGIAALIGDVTLFRGFHKRAELMRAVRDFDAFDHGNDPYGEHDMGSFEFDGTSCMWKIDYYNRDLSAGSEDPADSFQTVRVLTIMRADER
ncbi:DUF3768 domain-containing protein [Sphingomonas sp. Root720]|uniref:DUF3768 domain-containing protein n=1 Tax=Sphingomonas sp. Root720 TaxID=1736595 RepID=UPI0006FA5AF3|nr:DUF3768 domain-containing protein [Sphingomonas sp. Root720]KRB93226.1 hypothetical protein ASE22_25650 [Sphingomonas sp. Root720]